MVAFTAPDCLPYFQCTDSPCLNTGTTCEPSTVWCDLTALLEPRLNVFDATLARTNVAVPFAKVARFAVQTINTNVAEYDNLVQFDSVLADNANMVDLDVDSRFIMLNRPGTYWLEGYMAGFPSPVVDNGFLTAISQGGGSQLTSAQTMWRSGVVYNRVAHTLALSQTTINSIGSLNIGMAADRYTGPVGNGIVTVNYCELTAFWTADF